MDGTPRARIVAMLNQKGGVGKTTSTVNLGAAMAEAGLRVLLVDLDPQSNLSLHFGVEPGESSVTVYDLLLDPEARAEEAVVAARPNLHFIPSVTELALVEGELAPRPEMQRSLERALRPLLANYDVVLLDCPPSLGVLTVNALTLAHEVIVPMQAQYLALRGLEKLLATVHLVSQGLNPKLRVSGILLCMHEGQSSHGKAVVEEMRTQLEQYRGGDVPWSECEVLLPPIRRNVKLAEAPSFGQTIFDYAPQCAGAQDYRALAESIRAKWGRSTAMEATKEPMSVAASTRPPARSIAPEPVRSAGAEPARSAATESAQSAAPEPVRSGGLSLG